MEGNNKKIAATLFEAPYGWYTKEFAYVPDDTPEGSRRQMLPPVAKSWIGTTADSHVGWVGKNGEGIVPRSELTDSFASLDSTLVRQSL